MAIPNDERWDAGERKLVAAMVSPPMDAAELDLFERVCRDKELSPFSKQIYPQKNLDRKNNTHKLVWVVSIDGLRVIAQRNQRFLGITEPQWAGKDGVWKDVWASDEPPVAARVGVYMRDCPAPTYGVAHFDEYAQTYYDKNAGKHVLNSMWSRMGRNQIAKCAEAMALRKACPEMGGLYEADEVRDSIAEAPSTTPTLPPVGKGSIKAAIAPAPVEEPETVPADDGGTVNTETGEWSAPEFGETDALVKSLGKPDDETKKELTGAYLVWKQHHGGTNVAANRGVLRALRDRGIWKSDTWPTAAEIHKLVGLLDAAFDYSLYE